MSMTDCEMACKNTERALAAEITAQIYKWRSEGKTDKQIIDSLLQQLPKYQG